MIDLTQTLSDRNGVSTKVELRVVEDGDYAVDEFHKNKVEKVEATLGQLIENALLKDYGLSSEEEILKYFDLYQSIKNQTQIAFTEDELVLVKSVICKTYDTYFAGTLFNLIKKS